MANSQPSSAAASGDLVRSSGWRVVLAAGLAVFMATFDMTVVAVALPTISAQLDVSPALGELLILAYAGAMVALALPAGRWVNTADARGAFVVAVGGFAVASVAAGLAPGFWALVGARLAQGAFGALVASLVPVIAMRAVPLDQRGRALGLIGTLGPLGAVTDLRKLSQDHS